MTPLPLPLPPGAARFMSTPRDLVEQRRQWVYLWIGYLFPGLVIIIGIAVGLRTQWGHESQAWIAIGVLLGLTTLPLALRGRVRYIVPVICLIILAGCSGALYLKPQSFGGLGGLATMITLVSLTEPSRRILHAGAITLVAAATPNLLGTPGASVKGGLDLSVRIGVLLVITGLAYVGARMSSLALDDLRAQINRNQAKAKVLHQRHSSLEQAVQERTQSLAERTAELEVANFELQQAVEIEAGLAEQLRRQSLHDELTQLVNRRGFMNELNRVEPMGGWIVMADLDHFKSINDTWGHPAGDDALRHFAEVLTRITPSGGLPARVGGEEFAVVLPGSTTSEGLGIFLQQVLSEVRALVIPSMRGQQMTVSLGAAGFAPRSTEEPAPPAGQLEGSLSALDTPSALTMRRNALEALRLADHALYQAKNDGRDRAVINPTIVGLF